MFVNIEGRVFPKIYPRLVKIPVNRKFCIFMQNFVSSTDSKSLWQRGILYSVKIYEIPQGFRVSGASALIKFI
jgi:hypothetical protein